MNRILILALASLALSAEPYFPPSDASGGWRALSDAARVRKLAGIDLKKLDAAFEYAQRTSQHGGLLVVRHGYLVYEKYYGRGNREATPASASVGKAFTSIASGIMLRDQEDKFPAGLDQKVFNPTYLPEAMPLKDPRKADITLGQLLSMAAGFHGEGANPGFLNFEPSVKLTPVPRLEPPLDQDQTALQTELWTTPGAGYSYASSSPHVASIVLRHATGMEMQDYIDLKIAKPLGWGPWGYAVYRNGLKLHTPGGGDIALRATDALRFGYMLLHQGQWGSLQVVPAAYVALCGKPSAYQMHAPFSLMFEVNADRHVAGAPPDAYFKSGGGGFGMIVVPSLDLVIYKMAGSDAQYDPALTRVPQDYRYDGSRDGWKPSARSQFSDGPIGTDDGVRRVLEMVAAAVIE